MQLVRPFLHLLASSALVSLLLPGCASRGATLTPADISRGVAERSGTDPRGWPDRAPGSLPPDVVLQDGLSLQEAVSVALWNNPGFQVVLTDLGIARADVIEAGLLRNPVLSLLLPWGPKQLELTANWAIDAIWQRPRRLTAARLDAESIGSRLVQDGLDLAATVRTAYVDVVAAERRAQLAREGFTLTSRLAELVETRFKAGEISEREARSVRTERVIVEGTALSADHDRTLADIRLKALMGLSQDTPIRLEPLPSIVVQDCGAIAPLLKEAAAARPDVRAAELAVEAAGARAGLARAQIMTVTGILDANAKGAEGFEMGPGVAVELPIFSRNTGGRARAQALLDQAGRRYLAVRARVDEDVRTAAALLAKGREAVALWESGVVESVATEQRQTESAYQAGEMPLLALLDVGRRSITVRLGGAEARRDWLAAAIALDRAIGRSCALK